MRLVIAFIANRILVTSANGFIGLRLTETLVKEGDKVKALSKEISFYNSFDILTYELLGKN